MDQIEIFTRAVDQTGRIVAGAKPDHLGAPTPCFDWDVRALLNQPIGGVRMFDDACQGKELNETMFTEDMVGADPSDSYDQAAAGLKESVRQPGVLDRVWTMPFGATPGQISIGIAT